MRIGAVIIVLWLLIGGFAAYQRGYFGQQSDVSCAQFGTVLVTIVVGPLNYLGVNPRINCAVPKPSP